MLDKTRLIDLIKAHALEVKPDGEFFTLKSGAKSSYYLDLRNLHLTPGGLQVVVAHIWRELDSVVEHDAIGGPCIGADPIIGALIYSATPLLPVRGFLVRKATKEHGLAGRIVGPLKPGDHCVLIEDVVTSGGSSLDAIDAIEDFGAKVVQVISVVDRLAGGIEKFAKRGIPYKSLLDIIDLGLMSEAPRSKVGEGTLGSASCEVALNKILIRLDNAVITKIIMNRHQALKSGLEKLKTAALNESLDRGFTRRMLLLLYDEAKDSFKAHKDNMPEEAYSYALCCYKVLYRQALEEITG